MRRRVSTTATGRGVTLSRREGSNPGPLQNAQCSSSDRPNCLDCGKGVAANLLAYRLRHGFVSQSAIQIAQKTRLVVAPARANLHRRPCATGENSPAWSRAPASAAPRSRRFASARALPLTRLRLPVSSHAVRRRRARAFQAVRGAQLGRKRWAETASAERRLDGVHIVLSEDRQLKG